VALWEQLALTLSQLSSTTIRPSLVIDLISSIARLASTLRAEPDHGHLSIEGLQTSQHRARELTGSASTTVP